MADDSAITVVSPDAWKKSYLAKKAPDAGVKTLSPEEWKASYKAKKSDVPDASKMTQAQAVQQLEGGGLQAPAVDPIDLLTFGAAGGALGAVRGPAAAGLEALREAGTVGAAELWNSAAAPVIQRAIPGKGVGSQIARNAAQTASGFVPFVVAGAGPQALGAGVRKVGGESAIAEQGVKAGTEAGTKAESAQTSMAEHGSKAQADLDQKYAKFREQQKPELQSQAREETIKGTIGQTPSSTMEQGPERITRGEQFRESTTVPLERWRSDWATRRNKLLESQANTVVDDAPLQTAVTDDESKWQPNARPYSPAAQRLIDKVKGLGQEPGPLSDLFTDEEWAKLTPTQRNNYLRSAGRAESPAKIESYRTPSPQAVAEQATEGPTRTRPKVPELIGLQSEANTLARTAKGADRTLALKVVHGIDDALAGADIDVPAYKKIQAEYRDHRAHFPYSFEDAIQGAARPVDAAGQIFSEPERALDLVNLSNDSEKGNLRQLYGQWIEEKGSKAVTKEQQPFLAKLYPNSPLSKPEAWVYYPNAEAKFADVVEHTPAAQRKFLTTLDGQRQQLLSENSTGTLKLAKQLTDKLGTTGDRIWAKIQAGKTPEEQARIAYQEFGALNPAEEAQTAGVKAIQTASAPPPGGALGQIRRRGQMYAILALSGRPFFERMGILLGGPIVAHEVIRQSVLRSLRDPASATQLYRAYINPGATGSMQTITKNIIMGALPGQSAEVGQAVTAKPQSSSGPMVKHIEQKKAENIAGPRGAVSPARISAIQDTSKKIATGDAPDIQADLRNGRLSHSDVAQMLKPDKGGVAGLFEGLTPQQAVDAFAHADPNEREMTLPALAQHLQDSKLPPDQMKGILAQLKAVMTPPQQEGAEA